MRRCCRSPRPGTARTSGGRRGRGSRPGISPIRACRGRARWCDSVQRPSVLLTALDLGTWADMPSADARQPTCLIPASWIVIKPRIRLWDKAREGNTVDYVEHFRREVAAFEAAGRVAAGFEAAPAVPSCPEWVMTDLVLHLGRVHRIVARIIGERMQE